MVFILIFVVGLVAWALHLMQKAVEQREFSLMLAGFLVSVAAAATMSVYFLMSPCVGYLAQASQHTDLPMLSSEDEWALPASARSEEWLNVWADAADRQLDRF